MLRKRDLAFLVVLVVAIYISLDTTSFTYRLQPAWYYDQREATESSHYHEKPWQMLAPLVVDLDGDDSKEIVFITKDQFVKILKGEPPEGISISEDIYPPQELASTPLSDAMGNGKPPVALKAGYIEAYNENKSRKQVIVVVREDLTVLCYDEMLHLLWQKQVAHKAFEIDVLGNRFYVEQVAVIVSPLSLREGHFGTVIVGVSLKVKPEYEDMFKLEEGIDMSADGGKEHPEMEMRNKLEHFSVFALDAHTGHVIWKHDGNDVKAEQYTKSLPQHAYKLEAGELARQHHGHSDWTVFRQSLTAELPHDWHEKDDTNLRFAHFVRRHLGADAPNQIKGKDGKFNKLGFDEMKNKMKRGSGKALTGQGKFSGVETPPLAMSATLPHDASEHTDHPNVIVAHTKRGVEVIALKTGLPMTSLALTQGQSYADLNGDGMVDSLLVLEDASDVATHGQPFAHEGGELQHCTVMAVSGLPPRSQLFNGSLCFNHRSLQDPLSKKTKIPPVVTAASPLILKALDPNTMRESKIRDVIIAINIGNMACYKGNGEYKWHLKNTPTWDLDSDTHAVLAFDSDAVRVDELGTHDNRHAQILVMGDTHIMLISREGTIETQSEVPSRALTKPTIGDFDNDFINDVIVLTDDALLGYRLEITASGRGMLIAFTILAAVAVVVFVSTLKTEIVSDTKGQGGSVMTARKVFGGKRSTDEYHID